MCVYKVSQSETRKKVLVLHQIAPVYIILHHDSGYLTAVLLTDLTLFCLRVLLVHYVWILMLSRTFGCNYYNYSNGYSDSLKKVMTFGTHMN